MFNFTANRRILLIPVIFLVGYCVGHVGLFESAGLDCRAGVFGIGGCQSDDKPEAFLQDNSHLISSDRASVLPAPAAEAATNAKEPQSSAIANLQPTEAYSTLMEYVIDKSFWEVSSQSPEGNVVVSMEEAGITNDDSVNQGNTILGMIIEAN